MANLAQPIFAEKTIQIRDNQDVNMILESIRNEIYNGEYTIENVELPPEEQIAELKEQLSATDYKVIKCYECQLVGEVLPYDIVTLHSKRQVLRDEINRLEEQLKEPIV